MKNGYVENDINARTLRWSDYIELAVMRNKKIPTTISTQNVRTETYKTNTCWLGSKGLNQPFRAPKTREYVRFFFFWTVGFPFLRETRRVTMRFARETAPYFRTSKKTISFTVLLSSNGEFTARLFGHIGHRGIVVYRVNISICFHYINSGRTVR